MGRSRLRVNIDISEAFGIYAGASVIRALWGMYESFEKG